MIACLLPALPILTINFLLETHNIIFKKVWNCEQVLIPHIYCRRQGLKSWLQLCCNLYIKENCGQMWLIRPQLWLFCSCRLQFKPWLPLASPDLRYLTSYVLVEIGQYFRCQQWNSIRALLKYEHACVILMLQVPLYFDIATDMHVFFYCYDRP